MEGVNVCVHVRVRVCLCGCVILHCYSSVAAVPIVRKRPLSCSATGLFTAPRGTVVLPCNSNLLPGIDGATEAYGNRGCRYTGRDEYLYLPPSNDRIMALITAGSPTVSSTTVTLIPKTCPALSQARHRPEVQSAGASLFAYIAEAGGHRVRVNTLCRLAAWKHQLTFPFGLS